MQSNIFTEDDKEMIESGSNQPGKKKGNLVDFEIQNNSLLLYDEKYINDDGVQETKNKKLWYTAMKTIVKIA